MSVFVCLAKHGEGVGQLKNHPVSNTSNKCAGNVQCAYNQSRKNPVSASAMLTGKFLKIRKVFAKSSLLAEKFPVRSRRTGKFPDNLKFMYNQNNVRIILKESG